MKFMPVKFCILIFCTAIVFMACKTQTPQKQFSSEATKEFNFKVKKGEEVQFKLESNPSTGYSWVWMNKPKCTALDSISVTYKGYSNDGRVGGGGLETWTFKSKKPGTNTIKLEYKQPWDASSTVKTQEVIVNIQ